MLLFIFRQMQEEFKDDGSILGDGLLEASNLFKPIVPEGFIYIRNIIDIR